MTFTPLETGLISILAAVVTSGGVGAKVFVGMTKKYMTRNECDLKHLGADTADSNTAKELSKVSTKQDLQFRMLRAVILELDLSKDKKSEILNMRAGNGRL